MPASPEDLSLSPEIENSRRLTKQKNMSHMPTGIFNAFFLQTSANVKVLVLKISSFIIEISFCTLESSSVPWLRRLEALQLVGAGRKEGIKIIVR